MLKTLINQRLGRYYIKELLGRGGMAAVYRASDTVLQRDVALKILYPQFGDDASLVQRFQREAVTAAALEHPNIVPVYDVGEQDGMAYIAMKLLSGQTLQERLQVAGAVGLDELLRILRPVAAALDYAHARGIVHRDIKPGNIFLSETPDGQRVMLTDFGIAKQLDTPGLTTTGALIGTPDYMAPEQIAGRSVDARTDVYALGMLAYRALTGRRAFEGSTQDVLLGHLYDRPPPPSQVNPALPPAVDAVIARATAPDPANRFARAGELAEALAAVAEGRAVAAAGTAVGIPPALAAAIQAPTVRQPAPPRQTPPQVVIRGPATPAAAGAAATGETAGVSTFAGTAPAARGGAAPWLASILLALVAGGLAVALFFVLGRADSPGVPTAVPPPPPVGTPSPTGEPPSQTPDSAAVATATSVREPTATATAPATQTAAPSAVTTPTLPPPPPPPPPPPATATATTPPPPTATPSASPSPTASPTPSETATPTTTPTPTEEPLACDDSLLAGGFGRIFEDRITVRTAIGCPLEAEVAGEGSVQFFEGGMMFYWDNSNPTPNADYIYVFYGANEGEYDALSPQAVAALGAEPTPGPDPNQPQRGFGIVYYGKPGVRDLLGAPTSPEIKLAGENRLAVTQRFENGMMIYTPVYQPTSGRSIFVLYNDGRFERFDDAFAG